MWEVRSARVYGSKHERFLKTLGEAREAAAKDIAKHGHREGGRITHEDRVKKVLYYQTEESEH